MKQKKQTINEDIKDYLERVFNGTELLSEWNLKVDS